MYSSTLCLATGLRSVSISFLMPTLCSSILSYKLRSDCSTYFCSCTQSHIHYVSFFSRHPFLEILHRKQLELRCDILYIYNILCVCVLCPQYVSDSVHILYRQQHGQVRLHHDGPPQTCQVFTQRQRKVKGEVNFRVKFILIISISILSFIFHGT